MATTHQENTSADVEGQAPIKADTLRTMLYDSKATADDLRAKLASSERMRADMANRMAAHAETIQRLHSLNELVFEMGEGVILHVRRPDETQSYPILIPKAALKDTDPSKWMSDVVDPAAKSVLAAAERADKWLVDDPEMDGKALEDYQAVRDAFGIKGTECGAWAVKLVESVADLTSKHLGAVTSAGLWESKAKAAQKATEDVKDEFALAMARGEVPAAEKPPETTAPLTTAEIVQRQAEAASQEARTKRAEGIKAMADEKKAAEEEKKARKVRTDARRKARAEAAKEGEKEGDPT